MRSARLKVPAGHAQLACITAEREIEWKSTAVGFSGYGEAKNVTERDGLYVSLIGGHSGSHSPNDIFEKVANILLLQCRRVLIIQIADEWDNQR